MDLAVLFTINLCLQDWNKEQQQKCLLLYILVRFIYIYYISRTYFRNMIMMSMPTLIICVRKYVSYSTTIVAYPLFPMLCSGKNSLWVTYPGSMELLSFISLKKEDWQTYSSWQRFLNEKVNSLDCIMIN